MFQKEHVNLVCVAEIYDEDNYIAETCRHLTLVIIIKHREKIVSENELQLVRQDHTYELWGYSIYKTYQRPKNKLKYCG